MTLVRMTSRLLGRGVAGLAALLVGVALFESLQAPVVESFGGARGISTLIESLPPAFQALARAQPGFSTFSGLAGSLSAGFTHPLYLVLTLAAVVGFAARSLAGEMERGTILLSLARPVSRPAAYAARVAGVVLTGILLSLAGAAGLVGGLLVARPEGEFEYRNLVPLAVSTWLVFWAVGGLALAASAAASTSGRVVGWAIGFVVISYFVDYFAAVWTLLRPFEFLSIFAYYDPARALTTGDVPVASLLVLGLVGLAGVMTGLVVFDRRDLPT
ncbi:MAG: ABC transporter permease subunit [Chloroflexia bacterium]|nr:ABC transporter permease subunit [Chloroflexia bacterium]